MLVSDEPMKIRYSEVTTKSTVEKIKTVLTLRVYPQYT